MLERAEKRKKQLGISTSTKFPTMSPMKDEKENKSTNAVVQKSPKKYSSPRKSNRESLNASSSAGPLTKTTKVTNNVNKEDSDVAVEINITSNQNIQVNIGNSLVSR